MNAYFQFLRFSMDLEIGKVLALSDFIRMTDDLAQVLKSSIGIDGKAVLISQKSPRQITVTKVTRTLSGTIEEQVFGSTLGTSYDSN